MCKHVMLSVNETDTALCSCTVDANSGRRCKIEIGLNRPTWINKGSTTKEEILG